MRKRLVLIGVVVLVALFLTACGSMSEEDVLDELSANLEKLDSYRVDAHLMLHSGEQPLEYDVEVWYESPHYYRIALQNMNDDITQIILRNDEGVFVLTPHLNKSFKFQSGWPDDHGQVYLYQSLVQDILSDPERVFEETEDGYVFETAANYPNHMLTRQRIHLSDELHPVEAEIMDADWNVLVQVMFTNMEFGVSFDSDAFDMQYNMQGAMMESLPTITEEDEDEVEPSGSFGVYYPSYIPMGVEHVDEEEVVDGEHSTVVLRYEGDYNFTLLQERSQASMVHMPAMASPVELDFTVGVMGERSLSWTYDGVDFYLASDDLPEEEMMAIARSVYGQSSK